VGSSPISHPKKILSLGLKPGLFAFWSFSIQEMRSCQTMSLRQGF
jgi:hypothetical protein